VARVSSPEFSECGVSVLSQGSGNRPLSPTVIMVYQRVKVEDEMAAAVMKNSNSISKRKKEQHQETRPRERDRARERNKIE
jgi:hypothetical protein